MCSRFRIVPIVLIPIPGISIILFSIFLIVLTALSTCSGNATAQHADRTVSWFMDHPDDLANVTRDCRNDPGALRNTRDCVNADKARLGIATRQALGNADRGQWVVPRAKTTERRS